MYSKKEIFTFSNFLSFFRLLMAVPYWLLLNDFENENTRYLLFGLCIFGSLTDIADGYFARKLNQVTEFGKVIDPLADKVAVGAIIIKLYLIGQIPTYYFLLIIGRDILIFLGGILVTKKIGKVLPSNMLGKITVINIGIVILLILLKVDRENLVFLSIYGLSIFLIFASLIGYIIRAMEFLRQKKNYESV